MVATSHFPIFAAQNDRNVSATDLFNATVRQFFRLIRGVKMNVRGNCRLPVANSGKSLSMANNKQSDFQTSKFFWK